MDEIHASNEERVEREVTRITSAASKRIEAEGEDDEEPDEPEYPDEPEEEEEEEAQEEVKHVFGKCVDTSSHKQVPCPGKSDKPSAQKQSLKAPDAAAPKSPSDKAAPNARSLLHPDPAAHRPSKPSERHKDSAPKALEWKDPPAKKGKKGSGPIERPKGDNSQTKLGDQAEALAEKLGFRSILPEGKRSNRDVKTEGSSIDLEYDHSGRAYELKMCRTESTEYRLKAKKEEKEDKLRYAEMHKLTPHTMVGVRDGDTNEVHFYAAKEPGMIGAEVGPDKFDFVGTVKF